jgi:hypothetical protein
MSTFAQRAVRRAPPRVVVFSPSTWADTWPERPTGNEAIGLRVPSDHEVSCARAEAARVAWKLHPKADDLLGRIAAHNDALLRELCCLGMCDPNDVTRPYFKSGIDDANQALSSHGAKAVFDALEKLQLETSPVYREASDDELLELARYAEFLPLVEPDRRGRLRRLVAHCFDELKRAAGDV